MIKKTADSRLNELEIEFKLDSLHRRRRKEITQEAIDLCYDHQIPFPDWIDPWHLERDPFQERADKLEQAFNAGNLGALADMVYWCRSYNEPLPNWASSALIAQLLGFAAGNKLTVGGWRKWGKKYAQNMKDFEVFEAIKDLRGEYLEPGDDRGVVGSADIHELAGALVENAHPEDKEIKEDRIKKAEDRVREGLKINPLQYMLLNTFPCDRPKEKLLTNVKLLEFIAKHFRTGPKKKT
ncbi:MAG: hypothetical protein CTY34_05285 [Methylobacter sp.]|nr:MAG: hypothetical protein CTY34_05285 [Methylobacter sp.]PPD19214.1 MAG: hypothetical protein CTY24_11325 [Methylobacter sp.]PPD36812.1 MAG: hypothetical protein CTY18_03240 [Methylomonas sp.]